MTRRGAAGAVPMAIAIMGIVIIVAQGALYTKVVSQSISAEGDRFYTDSVVGEELLEAPCATKSRGVFYNESIVSGDLDCLNPFGGISRAFQGFRAGGPPFSAIFVEFNVTKTDPGDWPQEFERYRWTVVNGEDGLVVVEGHPPRSPTPQRYQTLVYDETEGNYTTARVRVGAQRWALTG